jgi:hypothetical protein
MADPTWPRSYPPDRSTPPAADDWGRATWELVEGRTVYPLPDGSTARADDPAARLQWGPVLFVPVVDYALEAHRVVMTSAPTADQAAAGVPLALAFRQA